MKIRSLVVAAALVTLGAPAWAQQAPPMPKPGPEHELLKKDVGTWDAVVEISPAPGAPVQKSKGVEVTRMGCGGLCLITDFKADMMGMPFEGHGVSTWDAKKGKYVGTWIDSMSAGITMGESTYDKATNRITGTMEGPDASGTVMKTRAVTEYKGDNTRVFTMYFTGPDGKEVESMKITYTRRK